jgi:hypothetical protein
MRLAIRPQVMRAFRVRNVIGLIVWGPALVSLMACPPRNARPVNQLPSNPHVAAPQPAPAAIPHPAWRPLHKGYADIATGVYIREDDDLVVNTPFPIVLRRTYNSLDGHPRQFGAFTTHPGEWWI